MKSPLTCNGPNGVIVGEMIKKLHMEKLHCREVFSRTLDGLDGTSEFVEDREIGSLEETGCCSEERDQELHGNCADQ